MLFIVDNRTVGHNPPASLFMAMCQFEWSTIDDGSLASNSSIKCNNLYNVGESLSQME